MSATRRAPVALLMLVISATALTTTTFDAGNHLTKWGAATLMYDLNGN